MQVGIVVEFIEVEPFVDVVPFPSGVKQFPDTES
jgi:hypothetical protein